MLSTSKLCYFGNIIDVYFSLKKSTIRCPIGGLFTMIQGPWLLLHCDSTNPYTSVFYNWQMGKESIWSLGSEQSSGPTGNNRGAGRYSSNYCSSLQVSLGDSLPAIFSTMILRETSSWKQNIIHNRWPSKENKMNF